ncbi:MAG: LysR family transcriptional regulator [Bradyrhizobiaceae bacterium]|nr:LysR family transcriptional regulator [Bradyrhizobiaceae bacterium]
MDRLRAMSAFVAVAEAEGFAAAAKRAGMSPPAITRAVAALEEHLGTRLFKRTTRVVRLSEAGVHFLADCKRILAEIEEAEASAAGAHAAPQGSVAVTAPAMFGRLFVAPVVTDFLAQHPQMRVRLLLVDRVVDLIEEGLDVAVRIAHLPDSSLTAVLVGSMRRVVCAAPAYLAQRGVPREPRDLAHLEAIYFSFAQQQQWTFRVNGRPRIVRPPAHLVANTAEVAVTAAVAGRGVARVLSYQVEREVRTGALQIVLREFEPPPIPVHVVHAEGRRAPARVRAFVDFVVRRLRAEDWLA